MQGWRLQHAAPGTRSLGRIQIAGNDPAKTVFYTSLYHAMLQPRTYSDVSGTYPRFHDHGEVEHTDDDAV